MPDLAPNFKTRLQRRQIPVSGKMRGTTTERGYGWEWQNETRPRILERDNYLCQSCLRKGKYREGTEVDHIIRKADGGTDKDNNLQTLCHDCHKNKTYMENRGVLLLPKLPKPACRVILVAGPPGSGKSTWVHKRRKKDDSVIDLDVIAARLAGTKIHQAPESEELFAAAIRERNIQLGNLSEQFVGRCYFIAGAPTIKERQHWRDTLDCEVVMMETPATVCINRIWADKTRAGRERDMIDWVKKWYKYYQKDTRDSFI